MTKIMIYKDKQLVAIQNVKGWTILEIKEFIALQLRMYSRICKIEE